MRKEGAIGIISCLSSVLSYICLGENIAVTIRDTAPDYIFGKRILPLVVRTVYKRGCPHNRKINNVSHQSNKQNNKKVGNPGEFPILCALSVFGAASVSAAVSGRLRILGCPSSSFGLLFFPGHFPPPFLFQALLLRLHGGYIIPV